MTVKIDDNMYSYDLSVKIGENVYGADIIVKIGENVYGTDFTVGITSNKNKADFIITKSVNADFTVKAGENIYGADITIKAGENVYGSDVVIKVTKSGTVDYLVFSEKPYVSLTDIVVALLPAINKELDYKFKKIPIYVEEASSNNGNSNSNMTEIISILSGTAVFAQDDYNTYLGNISNEYDSKSIFNEYGTYGNEYNSKSIWNEYGTFGGKYSSYSPFNEYTSTPPMIVKNGKIIGYLTVNSFIAGGLSPYILKGLKDKF
jgi:hypothetical protein